MTRKDISQAEFVALVAVLTALAAMSIDTMLPAIGTIAAELGATGENSRQYVLYTLFGGLAVGQLLYGPWSDSIGRRPAILSGLIVYLIGTMICLLAPNFDIMLLGRAIQGFGASGPRIVSIATVRDRQAGAAMARVMSLVMSVFMLVPILAPAIGQLVLHFFHWHAIFVGFLIMATLATIWVWFRAPETLAPDKRARLHAGTLSRAALQVVTTPVTIGYTLAAGFIFGAFVTYLGTSQQIFVEQYGQGGYFALYFGILASAIGLASIVNSRIVMRFGMRRLTSTALWLVVLLSVSFLIYAVLQGGHPPFGVFVIYMFANFFCNGILFGNFNALAMEPMGRIAGMASSIVGTLTTLISLICGMLIGQLYDGTIIPLVAGFAGLGLLSLLTTRLAERGRKPVAA